VEQGHFLQRFEDSGAPVGQRGAPGTKVCQIIRTIMCQLISKTTDEFYKKDPLGKIDPSGAGEFVSNYQKYVPDSYRIVNTVDPVPHSPSAIVPPPPPPRFPPPIWIPLNVFAHVLGDNDAIKDGIVSPNPSLDQNIVSFTDENPQNE